jgi:hypothetical protein
MAEPLSEEYLAEVGARAAEEFPAEWDHMPAAGSEYLARDARRLVAEVRRLRAMAQEALELAESYQDYFIDRAVSENESAAEYAKTDAIRAALGLVPAH